MNENNPDIPEIPTQTYNSSVPEELDLSHHINSITSFLFFIEQFRDEFKQKFNGIGQELESFKNNFDCSCRYKIIDFLKANELDALKFTKSFFDRNLGLRGHMSHLAQQSNFIEVSGTVETIDDTPAEWYSFIRKMNDMQYRFKGMNLVKDGSKLKIYFI